MCSSVFECLPPLNFFPQNRGIGEAIAQILAQNHQDPLALYATSRQGVNMAFKTASRTQVTYAKLDIADRSSVESFASTIKEKHGVVDVLINNAGVNLDDEYSAKNVKVTLDTNVRSTLQVSLYVFVGPVSFGRGLRSCTLSANWLSHPGQS